MACCFFYRFTDIIPRIWKPILEKLKNCVDKCALGFIQIMVDLLIDADSALKSNNIGVLRLLFKVYAYLFELQLPNIHDKQIHNDYVQAVAGCEKQIAALSNGCMNLTEINGFFTNASNTLNDSVNDCKFRCDKCSATGYSMRISAK